MYVNEELLDIHGWAIEWAYPGPQLLVIPKQEVEKSLFHITAKRLEINENVNRADLRTHWLVVKWCHEQSYSFRQSPKRMIIDRAQYVLSSSSLITTVVMTLLSGNASKTEVSEEKSVAKFVQGTGQSSLIYVQNSALNPNLESEQCCCST